MGGHGVRLVSWTLFLGIFLVIAGPFGILFFGLLIPGAEVKFLICSGIGLAIIIASIIAGFVLRGSEVHGGKVLHPRARIISRFAVNEVGELIFDDFQYGAPGGKLYVQIQTESGEKKELRSSYTVFLTCGEGMYGNLFVEGDWLSGFEQLPIPSRAVFGTPFNQSQVSETNSGADGGNSDFKNWNG